MGRVKCQDQASTDDAIDATFSRKQFRPRACRRVASSPAVRPVVLCVRRTHNTQQTRPPHTPPPADPAALLCRVAARSAAASVPGTHGCLWARPRRDKAQGGPIGLHGGPDRAHPSRVFRCFSSSCVCNNAAASVAIRVLCLRRWLLLGVVLCGGALVSAVPVRAPRGPAAGARVRRREVHWPHRGTPVIIGVAAECAHVVSR